MKILNQQLISDLGITLDADAQRLLEDHIETMLDERVVAEIADELSDEQAGELAAMKDSSDEELQVWLKTNVPELKEIIEDEVAILLGELAEHADKL